MTYTSDNIRLVAFALYCKEVSGDIHDTVFVKQVDINELWEGYLETMEGLDEEHFGDCTKDSCPCLRCHAEWFIEDAKYIIDHWQKNDEILQKRNVDIQKHLDESMLMSKAISKGDYNPTTISETKSGQTLIRTVDKKTGKTWEELRDDLRKKYQK